MAVGCLLVYFDVSCEIDSTNISCPFQLIIHISYPFNQSIYMAAKTNRDCKAAKV